MKLRIVPARIKSLLEANKFFEIICNEINKTQKGSCTLTASSVTTTVTDINVRSTSRIILFPTSANAAADVGSATGVYVSAKTDGTSFTITHPNNANNDKTFDYIIQN